MLRLGLGQKPISQNSCRCYCVKFSTSHKMVEPCNIFSFYICFFSLFFIYLLYSSLLPYTISNLWCFSILTELQTLGSSNTLESLGSAGICAPAKNAASECRFLFKWTNVQKISRIYADWIERVQLVPLSSHTVENWRTWTCGTLINFWSGELGDLLHMQGPQFW